MGTGLQGGPVDLPGQWDGRLVDPDQQLLTGPQREAVVAESLAHRTSRGSIMPYSGVSAFRSR